MAQLHYRKGFQIRNKIRSNYFYNRYIKMVKCQICPKQAYFTCSKCQTAVYCSKEHQIDHWRASHKKNCQSVKADIQQILKGLLSKRYHTRKQFYDNYSNKIYDLCLLDAKVMVDFDKKIKQLTKDILDEYEYGASVCLLCRIYYLVKDKNNARITIQNYLSQSQQFLTSQQSIPDVNGNFTNQEKQIFQKKMNLISTIANLSYALQLQCVKYYVLYTKHIEKAFGKNSFEASNCYFLLGCYFAEEGFMKKAIACFMKSAVCRDQLAGDCYFNIGILYGLQKKLTKALQMFEKALKLRMQQYGEDSQQLAEVQQNMGMIYVELNDYVTGMIEYEKAFRIRSLNPYSPQFKNVVDLIHELYDKLCLFITEQDEMKKPSIFLHLKLKIQDQDIFWKDRREKLEAIRKQQLDHQVQMVELPSKKLADASAEVSEDKKKVQSILVVSQELMAHLNSTQLFQLSDLQLQLSTTTSVFSAVYMIGKSMFLQKITPQNLQILVNDNPKLFKQLRLQELYKKKV